MGTGSPVRWLVVGGCGGLGTDLRDPRTGQWLGYRRSGTEGSGQTLGFLARAAVWQFEMRTWGDAGGGAEGE